MIIKNKNTAREYIKNRLNDCIEIYVKDGFKDSILTFMNERSIKYGILNEREFDKLYKDNQGIAIKIKDYEYSDINELIKNKKNNSICLILDSIEDPQNFGSIIRSFDIFGGDFIIIPKNRSVEVNETVLRVSEGALSYAKIAQVTNLNKTIELLKENGYWVYGADMDGNTLYDEIDVDGNIAIVIGSEGFGMSRLVKENCDSIIRIPMEGKINSLNASISAAVIISNIVSRRRLK